MRFRAVVSKQVLLGVIAAGLLVLALLIYLQAGRQEQAPADRFVRFHCRECGKTFDLSEREIDQMWEKRAYGRTASERGTLFRCKFCGEDDGRTRSGGGLGSH